MREKMNSERTATVERNTKETQIRVCVNLDGTGKSDVNTGLGFLDHMLDQLTFHGLLDLEVRCKGDLHIDGHHSTEDTALALGQAIREALGDKQGIQRFGHAYVPMDEALLRCVIDLSGRPEFVFQGEFTQPAIGEWDTQLIPHFFKSFALTSASTLHLAILYGSNDHHQCEGLFKALARALRQAVERDPRRQTVTSTKGTL
jgi:imidazoleglycerol-phosphate dehydratase